MLRVSPVPRLWGPGRKRHAAPTGPGWSIPGVHERQTHPLSENGQLHFLAFSRFLRRPYLSTFAAMELFEDALERVRVAQPFFPPYHSRRWPIIPGFGRAGTNAGRRPDRLHFPHHHVQRLHQSAQSVNPAIANNYARKEHNKNKQHGSVSRKEAQHAPKPRFLRPHRRRHTRDFNDKTTPP